MKLRFKQSLAGLLIFGSCAAEAYTWRQDIGYYEADGFWMGETFKPYNDFASGAKVKKHYLRSTFSTQMTEKTEASLAFEITSNKMDGFSAGNAKDGKGQTAISEVELAFSTSLLKSGSNSVTLDYGASFPGSEYESHAFDSVGTGVTIYKLGVGYSYSSESMVGFNASAAYWFKPGELKAGKGNSDGTPGAVLDLPDMAVISLGVPVYFGSNIVSLDLTNKTSIGGVDLTDTEYSNYSTVSNGRGPFPATKENITTLQVSYAKYFGEKSVDFSLSQQLAGRNTDRGLGINIGYQMEL